MIMIYSNWLLLQEIFESDVHIISYPLWCNTRAEKKEEKQQQNTQKERQNTQIRLFALMFFSSLLAHQSPPKMIVSVSLSFHLFVVFFFHPCLFFFLDCVYVCVCVCKKTSGGHITAKVPDFLQKRRICSFRFLTGNLKKKIVC